MLGEYSGLPGLPLIIVSGLYNKPEGWIWFYYLSSERGIYSSNKSILRAYYVVGGVLRAEGLAVNSTYDHSCPHGDDFLVGGERKQMSKKYMASGERTRAGAEGVLGSG